MRFGIGDGDKAGARQRRHLLRVIAAEVADAHHADPERLGAPGVFGALPRSCGACHDRARAAQAASSTKSSASSKRSWVM